MTDHTLFSVVIPARFASSRLPGKPLLDIAGKSMIQRVYEQATASRAARVWVATDDPRIADAVQGFGGEVCMTRADHSSGTDRLAEVVDQQGMDDDSIVVNVQGDEPLIPPTVIDQVAAMLAADPEAGIATLVEPIRTRQEVFNPNAVKVVIDGRGRALYFSRAPMPWARDDFDIHAQQPDAGLPEGCRYWRHIGIYAYRARLLRQFVQWPPSPLEQTEKLEQLRALEQGVPISVAEANASMPAGIDTPADLAWVREQFNHGGAAS